VFANKAEMDKLIDSLAWYSHSSKQRARLGRNSLLPMRYKHCRYSAVEDTTVHTGEKKQQYRILNKASSNLM